MHIPSADVTEAVLVEVERQHSDFPISLEPSEQEHGDGNDSVSDGNNNLMAQEICIPVTSKNTDLNADPGGGGGGQGSFEDYELALSSKK